MGNAAVRWLLLAAIAAPLTSGQGASGGVAVGPGFSIATGSPFLAPSLTGAPYSGEQVTETVQVLADGTRITRKQPSLKMYRDSAGRVRTERSIGPSIMARGLQTNAPVFVEIADPVSGIRYTLDAAQHVAHRIKLQPRPAPPVRVATGAPPTVRRVEPPRLPDGSAMEPPKVTSESLGSQLINGVQAEGTRTTTTFPTDSQGNDRPFTVISETWRSPELNITVLAKHFDPRNGESTTQMLNLSRAEPDPLLFAPPADYSIVDQPAPLITGNGAQVAR